MTFLSYSIALLFLGSSLFLAYQGAFEPAIWSAFMTSIFLTMCTIFKENEWR